MSDDFPARKLRIGTRSSPLALAQVDQVSALLREFTPALDIEVVPVTTKADKWSGSLSQLGGKGLFVREIDRMLQRGRLDLAVHCVKDVPGDVPMPRGLVFAAYLPRGDVRDVLVLPEGSEAETLDDLPPGASVGTSAVRREAQLRRLRPDLNVVPVRGLVGSRIDKLDGLRATDHKLDALVLARAGLERLGLPHRARQVFTTEEMLPAVGAGALGLECREDDRPVASLLQQINHEGTMTEIAAERAMLHGLRGHCNSPIAGHCTTLPDGRLSLRGMVFSPNGARVAHAHHRDASAPIALGSHTSSDLLRQGARGIIDTIPH